MKITRLQLENFRGFERLDLPLEPSLTLLIGENGAGKTAVLEALAVALGGLFLELPAWHRGCGAVRGGPLASGIFPARLDHADAEARGIEVPMPGAPATSRAVQKAGKAPRKAK